MNAAAPSRHWEVINAASPGYQLNLELAQIEAVLLRHRPDCVILLDGNNDLTTLIRNASATYDPYAATPGTDSFNLVANPGSFRSLLLSLSLWLRYNSAAFQVLGNRLGWKNPSPWSASGEPKRAPRTHPLGNPVQFADLTPAEQARFTMARSQLAFYPRLARQINHILEIDGAKAIFLLQPELSFTRKPLTDAERRLIDRLRRTEATPLLYGFQELYPEIAARMTAAAQQDGFVFESLVGVFDQTSEQTFTDDCHLTPEGNRIIAERLLPILKKMFAAQAPPR